MARMTKEERAQRKAERAAQDTRMKAAREEAIRIVATGKCPQCGEGFRRNLAMAGWYQCVQYGDGHFRKDQSKPSCSFQCFTE